MKQSSWAKALFPLVVSVATVVIALAISAAIIQSTGEDAVAALRALWDGAFGNKNQIAGTLSKMIPLILVALGWIVAFSTKRINIGFEGQILAGGIAATIVGLRLSMPAPLHVPIAVAAGVAGGAVWAGIAALLWARRNVNEIISTLMLNFIAIEIVSWLVRGPIQEPTHTFPRSETIPDTALWPRIIKHTSLGWDIFLTLAVVGVIAVVLRTTAYGFRLRLTGSNEVAARHAGVKTVTVTVSALVLSGALAGLAGSSLILGGETASMADNFSANFGFTGIVVALLARNQPIATVPAALLFSALRQGGGLMEARVGVSSAVVLVTQAVVILLVAAAAYLYERRHAVRVDTAPGDGDPAPAEAA